MGTPEKINEVCQLFRITNTNREHPGKSDTEEKVVNDLENEATAPKN